ncbi:MAG: BatA domain-containing protein [Candidatus Poribacteria bacterium]|mgnify:FL=1
MNFLNPFLLIGILAVGIPLIIHLWSRRHAKVIDFSSLQFLLSLNRRKVRRLRLKQILILILRMLIILLIVFAIARPIFKSKWLASASGISKRSVVIILDNSYSMGYSSLQGVRFDIAKDKSLNILDSLRSGDNASIILMSDIPNIVFKQLTSDIQQAKNTVQKAQVSYRGTFVPSSLLEAYSILKESKNPQRQVYLISDLGENGWKDWKATITEQLAQNDVETSIIRIGENADNKAIENVGFSSEIIGTGAPTQINAKIKGITSGQTIAELYIDGEKKSQATITGNMVSFTDVFQRPGAYTGEVRITPDRLPVDDSRFFAINVFGQIKALVAGDYRLYVNLALNPFSFRRLGSPSGWTEEQNGSSESEAMIQPILVPPSDGRNVSTEELGTASLDKYGVIVLVDVAKLNDNAVRNLKEFYSNGGNIVIFAGRSADRDWYNKLDFLPCTFGNRTTFTPTPLKISRWNIDHPIFSVFREEGMSGTLKSPEIYSAFSIIPKAGAEVISNFDKNIPAIIEFNSAKKDIKSGKVILFNLSPDPQVSDISLRPVFLPLIQQTVLYLVSYDRNNKNLIVGDHYSQNIYGKIDSIPKIIDPEGNESLTTLSESNQDGVRKISFDNTNHAGIYKVEYKSDGSLNRDYFAVNPATSNESELKSVKDEDIIAKLGNHVRLTPLNSPAEQSAESESASSDISSILLILAILLLLAEIPLANRYKTKESEEDSKIED